MSETTQNASLTAPAFIVSLVTEWVGWYEREGQRNPLGYPHETMEYKLLRSPGRGAGAGARSRVPLDQMPPRLAVVERAIRMMPEAMAQAVVYRQLRDYQGFALATGLSRPRWYTLSDQGYWFINGVVQGALG